jgi:hypothetical protein
MKNKTRNNTYGPAMGARMLAGLAAAAAQVAREERRAKITWDRDLNAENDCVLARMLKDKASLDLETYLDYAYLCDPPEGIEEDAEFLASVPDVILKNSRFVQ